MTPEQSAFLNEKMREIINTGSRPLGLDSQEMLDQGAMQFIILGKRALDRERDLIRENAELYDKMLKLAEAMKAEREQNEKKISELRKQLSLANFTK